MLNFHQRFKIDLIRLHGDIIISLSKVASLSIIFYGKVGEKSVFMIGL